MKRVSLVTIATLVVVAGCSDSDDPTGPGQALTEAEAAALAGVMTGEAFGSTEAQLPNGAQAAAPVPFDVDLSVTAPCPLGGQVAFQGQVTGEFDVEGESLTVAIDASQVHAGCAVDVDGVTMTLTGNPGLTFSSQLAAVGDPPVGTHTATLTGGVDWISSDGRSGTCTVSLAATQDLATQTGTASGTFCGHTLDLTVS